MHSYNVPSADEPKPQYQEAYLPPQPPPPPYGYPPPLPYQHPNYTAEAAHHYAHLPPNMARPPPRCRCCTRLFFIVLILCIIGILGSGSLYYMIEGPSMLLFQVTRFQMPIFHIASLVVTDIEAGVEVSNMNYHLKFILEGVKINLVYRDNVVSVGESKSMEIPPHRYGILVHKFEVLESINEEWMREVLKDQALHGYTTFDISIHMNATQVDDLHDFRTTKYKFFVSCRKLMVRFPQNSTSTARTNVLDISCDFTHTRLLDVI